VVSDSSSLLFSGSLPNLPNDNENIKLKYPLVNPEGHPDVYSGRMPRPIYEDARRYPWFFNKKSKAVKKKEKIRKKDRGIKQ
jgi:hypothetical protein